MLLIINILNAFLGSIIFGVFVSALLLIIFKEKIKSGFSLRNCAVGFGICTISNIMLLILTMGFISGYFYFIIFIPLMYFSFMLNKKLIKEKRLKNSITTFVYKITATLLIWFLAFFPFSLLGLMEIVDMPARNARNQEIQQLRDEILGYETFADLTPFGLGVYKLRCEGDGLLWDITKPEEHVFNHNGVDLVYKNHYNRRYEETWDNAWGNSNKGKNVMYDVLLYEGTYLIITPLWDEPGGMYYWGYIYLCKNIDKDVDLFDIGILDPEIVKKLRELPGEQISRMELAELLGKEY